MNHPPDIIGTSGTNAPGQRRPAGGSSGAGQGAYIRPLSCPAAAHHRNPAHGLSAQVVPVVEAQV